MTAPNYQIREVYVVRGAAGRRTAYAMTARVRSGEHHREVVPSPRTYAPEAITAAIAKALGTKTAVEERREAAADRGRDAILPPDRDPRPGEYAIKPGDVVTVRYREGTRRDETCVGVNLATGKVAVACPGAATGKRWLPATQVVAVKGKAP